MATKSFLSDVNIKEKHLGRTLVEALETANTKKTAPSKLVMPCREVTGKDIKKLLGGK